jgi:hypothetical protein
MLFVIYLEMNSRFQGKVEGYVFSILAGLIAYKLVMALLGRVYEKRGEKGE